MSFCLDIQAYLSSLNLQPKGFVDQIFKGSYILDYSIMGSCLATSAISAIASKASNTPKSPIDVQDNDCCDDNDCCNNLQSTCCIVRKMQPKRKYPTSRYSRNV